MSTQVRLLGPPEISRDGATVRIPRKKTRAVLFILASNPRRMPREQVVGLVWPELPLDRALRALRSALFELRSQLDVSIADESQLGLHLEGADVDVRRLVEAHARFQADPDDLEPLDRALRALSGPFLQGFELDERRFATWKTAESQQIEREIATAVERIGAAFEQRGDPETALLHARRFVARCPESERAHQLVIRLLGLLGRVTEAYQQFEECRRALRAAFGVEPSTDMRKLVRGLTEARLRELAEPVPEAVPPERPSLAPTERRSTPPHPAEPPHGAAARVRADTPLPVRTSVEPSAADLHDRAAPRALLDPLVARVLALLDEEGSVVLVGPPGSGARAVFESVAIRTAALRVQGVAPAEPAAAEPWAIDPATTPDRLAELLAEAGRRGQRALACTFRTPELTAASVVRVEPLTAEVAVAFLTERARLRGARLGDDAETDARLRALVDAAGRLPGVLAEVAARLADATPAEVLAGLTRSPLRGSTRLLEALDDDERAKVRLLAHFEGDLDPKSAAEILGCAPREILALQSLGVLHARGEAVRLEPALRLAARRSPLPEPLVERFDVVVLRDLERSEPADVLRAFRSALVRGDDARLTPVIELWIFDQTRIEERLPIDTLLEEAGAALRARGATGELLARVSLLAAIRRSRAGRPGAVRAFREAHALLAERGDRRGLLELDLAYAEEALQKGWLGPAEVSLQAAEDLAAELGDAVLTARVAVARTRLVTETRPAEEADRALRKALEALRRAGPEHLGAGWIELGRIQLRRGTPERAAAVLHDALLSLEEQGARRSAAEARLLLAEALLARFQAAEAEHVLAPLLVATGAPDLVARARRLEGRAALARGAYDDAERLMLDSALSLQALGHLAASAAALGGLGEARWARGDGALARQLWAAAVRVARAAGAHALRLQLLERLATSLPEASPPRREALERLTPTATPEALDQVAALLLAELSRPR